MNQLWDVGRVRDFWPRWTPAAIENIAWLNSYDCFRPKLFAAPNEADFNISASGYVILTFALVPGSWVIGFSEVNAESLDFQVTDLGPNFKFFSAPMSGSTIATDNGFSQPLWLPEPYMVVGPALLRVEVWNNTLTATAASQVILHVLEPREV